LLPKTPKPRAVFNEYFLMATKQKIRSSRDFKKVLEEIDPQTLFDVQNSLQTQETKEVAVQHWKHESFGSVYTPPKAGSKEFQHLLRQS